MRHVIETHVEINAYQCCNVTATSTRSVTAVASRVCSIQLIFMSARVHQVQFTGTSVMIFRDLGKLICQSRRRSQSSNSNATSMFIFISASFETESPLVPS
jgi:hypothetical protein